MAIKIVTGILGAGKTYFCVQELLAKYYTYSEEFLEWRSKGDLDVEIITNISGLKLPIRSLDSEILLAGGVEKYFSIDFHDDTKKKVMIIDEAQKLFPRKYYNVDVFHFFQYSRHLGIDIYLITQDVSALSRELQNLAEYEVRAVRKSLQLGFFRYLFYIDDVQISTKNIKRDKRVFAAYRSFRPGGAEIEKTKSVPLRNLAFFSVLVFGICFGGYLVFTKLMFPNRHISVLGSSPVKTHQKQAAVLPVPVSCVPQSVDQKVPFKVYSSPAPSAPESFVSEDRKTDTDKVSDSRKVDPRLAYEFARYVGYIEWTDSKTKQNHVIRMYNAPDDYNVSSGKWKHESVSSLIVPSTSPISVPSGVSGANNLPNSAEVNAPRTQRK